MRHSAEACRAVVHAVRLVLCRLQNILSGLETRVRTGSHDKYCFEYLAYVAERIRIESYILDEIGRVGNRRGGTKTNDVTIGRGRRERTEPDCSRRAVTVYHDHGLFDLVRQGRGDRPAVDVETAARGERDDHLDRAGR